MKSGLQFSIGSKTTLSMLIGSSRTPSPSGFFRITFEKKRLSILVSKSSVFECTVDVMILLKTMETKLIQSKEQGYFCQLVLSKCLY